MRCGTFFNARSRFRPANIAGTSATQSVESDAQLSSITKYQGPTEAPNTRSRRKRAPDATLRSVERLLSARRVSFLLAPDFCEPLPARKLQRDLRYAWRVCHRSARLSQSPDRARQSIPIGRPSFPPEYDRPFQPPF